MSGDVVSALDCRDDSQDFWNEYRILRVQHGSKKVELQRHGSVAWGTVGYIQATYKTVYLLHWCYFLVTPKHQRICAKKT